MDHIGKGIAIAGIFLSAAILEIHDKDSALLWLIGIVWALFTDWSAKSDLDEAKERQERREHVERMVRELPQSERAAFMAKYLDEATL